jgi:nucleoside-diphosphate-sugar epimerase
MNDSAATPAPHADIAAVVNAVDGRWRGLARQRILITGGTGFIGRWLLGSLLHANRILDLGCEVLVQSRDPEAFRRRAPELATDRALVLLRGDIRDGVPDPGHLDTVIHAATDVAVAGDPLDLLDACTRGTRAVLEASIRAGTNRFLLLSSGAVYGRRPAVPAPGNGMTPSAIDPLERSAAYGIGKLASEWLTAEFGRRHGMAVRIARCFAFVGPGLPMNGPFAIGQFIRDAVDGRTIEVTGDGSPVRTYLYAADLAAWLWTILLDGADGGVYDVGGEEEVSILELARRVERVLGATAGVRCARPAPARPVGERYVPDLGRARVELGLDVGVGLDEAIRRTACWYRSCRKPGRPVTTAATPDAEVPR